jgi:hypothetical protein
MRIRTDSGWVSFVIVAPRFSRFAAFRYKPRKLASWELRQPKYIGLRGEEV